MTLYESLLLLFGSVNLVLAGVAVAAFDTRRTRLYLITAVVNTAWGGGLIASVIRSVGSCAT